MLYNNYYLKKNNIKIYKYIINLATVITNLLSAIPVFGQDLVESTYLTEFSSCFLFKYNSLSVLAEMLQAQKNIVAFMTHLKTEKKERHFKLRKLI